MSLADEMRLKASTVTDRVYEEVVRLIEKAASEGRYNAVFEYRNFFKADWEEIARKLRAEGFVVELDKLKIVQDSGFWSRTIEVMRVYWD